MSTRQGKILVIRGGAIGDFILTLPAIAALRKQFPNVSLEVLGYPHIVELAIAGGMVDHVRSIEARALAGFFARGGELDEDLSDYFSEFDLIVSYLYDPDLIFQTNLALCSTAQFVTAPHRPDETRLVSAAQVYLQPLERLAIFDADPIPRLPLPRQPSSTPVTIAMHPGSGSERKNWPERHWAKLLEMVMQQTDWRLLLVGGEAEGDRLERLAAGLPPERVRVARSLPLAELAHQMTACRAFLGHDSGISHLAAAISLPGIALWGTTQEAIWRPPSPAFRILRHPGGMGGIQPVDVLAELNDLLDRPPVT